MFDLALSLLGIAAVIWSVLLAVASVAIAAVVVTVVVIFGWAFWVMMKEDKGDE